MIYVMSDIHGDIVNLEKNLFYIFNKMGFNSNDKIIFLGDYVDRGRSSKQVLDRIYELYQKYPNQIVALKGNHDEMFLAWLKSRDPLHLANDPNLRTVISFWNRQTFPKVEEIATDGYDIVSETMEDVTQGVIDAIKGDNESMLQWYTSLPYWYEENGILFVHAGFDDTKDDWRDSDEEYMTWKYPATYGLNRWNKIIVAGHINTSEVSKSDRNDLFISGHHVYIDGGAPFSGKIILLGIDRFNQMEELSV